MALDLERLIAPISDDAPCGPDLRGEPEFRDIEDAPGEFSTQAASELRKIVIKCVSFLERTHDQMPAIVAVQASIRAGDFDVANTGLQLIKAFAESYWEDFHPAPADEMAIGRVNELSALSRPAAMILPLQRAALGRMPAPSTAEFTTAMFAQASAPVLEWTSDNEEQLGAKLQSGALTAVVARTIKATHEGARMLRTIMRTISPTAQAADRAAGATGDDEVDGQAAPVAIAIRAQVAAIGVPLKAMSDVLYDIMSIYEGHSLDSPSFGPVITQLRSIDETITKFLEVFADAAEDAPRELEETFDEYGAVVAASPSRGFSGDTPRNRVEVDAALEAICRFYAETEPSSPVPLMLRRVQTWIHKDFMELMQEIAPNGADEATSLLAIRSE